MFRNLSPTGQEPVKMVSDTLLEFASKEFPMEFFTGTYVPPLSDLCHGNSVLASAVGQRKAGRHQVVTPRDSIVWSILTDRQP